ncbi:MAG: hypothetical protein DME26_09575 [Verrucomicrobia bacterium]|nr:MAG: hypothetical protein DME26_09575 [Verrucomicrobiota bacterium]
MNPEMTSDLKAKPPSRQGAVRRSRASVLDCGDGVGEVTALALDLASRQDHLTPLAPSKSGDYAEPLSPHSKTLRGHRHVAGFFAEPCRIIVGSGDDFSGARTALSACLLFDGAFARTRLSALLRLCLCV